MKFGAGMPIKTPNPMDQHVGSRLRLRRLEQGIIREKLGDALGLTFQQVKKYEKGTNRMGASRLQHAAHILDVSVQFFFEGAPGGHKLDDTAYFNEFVSSEEGLRLIQAFMRTSRPSLRRRVVDMVKEIAGT